MDAICPSVAATRNDAPFGYVHFLIRPKIGIDAVAQALATGGEYCELRIES